jgi:hypothetical protein
MFALRLRDNRFALALKVSALNKVKAKQGSHTHEVTHGVPLSLPLMH